MKNEEISQKISVLSNTLQGDGGVLKRLGKIEDDLKNLTILTSKLNGYYKFISPIITGLITSGAVYFMMRK
jgi:hypothetical protein